MEETNFDCHGCVFNRGSYCESDGDCLTGEKHGHKKEQAELSAKDIYKLVIDTYGRDNQLNMAIEEMAELIQAINKTRRYPDSIKAKDNVAEEMADVAIMLEQLALIYDCHNEVLNWKEYKIEKILENLMKD